MALKCQTTCIKIRQVVSSSDRMLQDHKILFPQNRGLQAQACIGVCAKLTCVKSQMTSSDVPHLWCCTYGPHILCQNLWGCNWCHNLWILNFPCIEFLKDDSTHSILSAVCYVGSQAARNFVTSLRGSVVSPKLEQFVLKLDNLYSNLMNRAFRAEVHTVWLCSVFVGSQTTCNRVTSLRGVAFGCQLSNGRT